MDEERVEAVTVLGNDVDVAVVEGVSVSRVTVEKDAVE